MPTIARIDGFRFYFYSHEPDEPPHVHVDRAGASAKVWLQSVALARSVGYKAPEMTAILGHVRLNQVEFLEAWNAFFPDVPRR